MDLSKTKNKDLEVPALLHYVFKLNNSQGMKCLIFDIICIDCMYMYF